MAAYKLPIKLKGICSAYEQSFFMSFSGPKLMDFTYHANLDHKCKKDILIGRIKNEDKSWKKIRPRPTKTNYEGPYYICKGIYCNYLIVYVI